MPKNNDLALLGDALQEIPGPLKDFLRKRKKDPKWDKAFELMLRGGNPGAEKTDIKSMVSGLFEVVKKVKLTELDEFRPADKFVAMSDEKDRAKALVSIGYVDPDLQPLMNKIGVESARGPQILTIRRTLKVATFGQMLPELPKRAKKVSMGQVWQMIEKQGQGQEGDLLVNGWANFFLLEEDPSVVLICDWDPGYRDWRFGLDPASYSGRWRDGRQFLS